MESKKENLESALRMVKEVDVLNETYMKMPEFMDYSVPVCRSAQICQVLLRVLLQGKGIDVDNQGIVCTDGKIMTELEYCVNGMIQNVQMNK